MADLIYYIGLATLVYHTWKAVQFALVYIYRTKVPLARYKRDDAWALITGASDGIGFGFAQVLRSQGWNLILLAHQAGKLDDARKKLEKEFPDVHASIEVLVYDAMIDSGPALEKAVEAIAHLPITLLINNVGGAPMAPPHFRPLSRYQLSDVDNIIAMNSRFMARITCLMLPVLARNGPSLIANMSSGAQIGIPWLSMYSATKGFVKAISYALARELRAEKVPVDVISMKPGDVRSFQHQVPLAWNVPTSRKLAESAVGGMSNAVNQGWLEWSPFWVHAILVGLLDRMPEWMRQAALADEIQKKHRMFDKIE